MPPSSAPEVVKVGTTINIMGNFKSIVINKENFKHLEVTLSSLRSENKDGEKYVDENGDPFSFYWISFNHGQYIACTGKKFTELLGTEATDETAVQVICEHLGEFQIAQAIGVDDDGKEYPVYVNDDEDSPLLKVQAVPHSATAW